MKPVTLHTARLVLDQPGEHDKAAIVEYCQDPLFERFMTLPWPYLPKHADYFVDELVPQGWANGSELTWALRDFDDGPLLGVIGWRAERSDVGFWLGAQHRGRGYMSEALDEVCAYVFSAFEVAAVNWECVVGNLASLGVARASGFRYTGEAPSHLEFRDGSHPLGWHAVFDRMPPAEDAKWPA